MMTSIKPLSISNLYILLLSLVGLLVIPSVPGDSITDGEEDTASFDEHRNEPMTATLADRADGYGWRNNNGDDKTSGWIIALVVAVVPLMFLGSLVLCYFKVWDIEEEDTSRHNNNYYGTETAFGSVTSYCASPSIPDMLFFGQPILFTSFEMSMPSYFQYPASNETVSNKKKKKTNHEGNEATDRTDEDDDVHGSPTFPSSSEEEEEKEEKEEEV